MEILFLVKQLITFVLFFMKFNKNTTYMIKNVMNLLLIEYPQLEDETEFCREQHGSGDDKDPETQKADDEAKKERERKLKDPTKDDLMNQRNIRKEAEKDTTSKKNTLKEKQSELSSFKNERDSAKIELDNAKKSGDERAIKNAESELEKTTNKTEEARKMRDASKSEVKKAKGKEFNEGVKSAQMANADFDKKNPDFQKFKGALSEGPIQGVYKMFQSAIKDVATLVKMFFFYLYEKSMSALLPFVMTMSFAFSFIRYLFQNVRNR